MARRPFAVRFAVTVAAAALPVPLAITGLPAAAQPAPPAAGAVPPAVVALLPVDGAVVGTFDPPDSPYGSGHRGVDLAADPGTPVVAALAGTVVFSGEVAGVGWVTIDHGGGLATTYGPLDPRSVAAGDVVGPGTEVGLVAPGADHLDWGARVDGAYVDPLALVGGWRVHLTRFGEDGRLRPLPMPVLGGPAALDVGRLAWPVSGRVSSRFGWRIHPISGRRKLHTGLDIAAPTGRPITAAADGTVLVAGNRGGLGLAVDIAHGGGLVTRYAHQSRLAVRAGQRVTRGQVIGYVGSTGMSTGPHLHFEVRVGGAPQDPLPWLGG